MHYFYLVTGAILGTVWLWKAVEIYFGLPQVDDVAAPQWSGRGEELRGLSVVVPARNEAASIRQCLSSLLALDYPALNVITIDDRSTDATGQIMDEVALSDERLRVIHVTDLPSGWLGKTHAMWTGASHASGEWILFTDGDVIFRADALRRAVTYASVKAADHLVVLPTMMMGTRGERMMMGFFMNNLAFVHRLWKVPDPHARDFTGAGAFNLIRRSVYEKVGTYESMRLQVLDDLALGKVVKDHKCSSRAALGPDLASLRWAVGTMGIVNNLTKNVFAVMRFNLGIALGAALGSAFIGLGPLVGLVFAHGVARIGFAIALLSMAAIYGLMRKVSRVSPMYFFTHPLACVLVIYTLLRSTFVTLWNGGVTWRGTKYSLDELRANSSF